MAVIITELTLFLNMLFVFLIFIIISITIHEFAHAYVANLLGDPTAKVYGRLSLNPLKHIDPFGLIALIIFRFGWGKPVPIDPYNFKNPKRDEILVSISGPLSNIVLAIIASLILKSSIIPSLSAISYVFYSFISLNIFLAIFNLLPIWPLDGSKIVLNLLPIQVSIEWQEAMEKYGFILIFFLAYTNILSKVVSFFSSPLITLLI